MVDVVVQPPNDPKSRVYKTGLTQAQVDALALDFTVYTVTAGVVASSGVGPTRALAVAKPDSFGGDGTRDFKNYPGSPIGNVTPDFVGQVLFDTTNSQWYVAYGTTSSSWRMAAEWLIDSSGNFTGLTGPSGATISVSGAPKDLLSGTLQHVSITSAISTTAVASATASGTYYKARVAWNNNGASGSANLNIAVNCDNDVHGLRCGQNSKRRDYQMLMGSGVILISETPITTLHFSADSSITANTHLISVTFGN